MYDNADYLKCVDSFWLQVGVHDHDHCLDDMSLEAYHKRRDRCQEFLERSKTVENELTHHIDSVNLRILQADLMTFVEGFPFTW